MAPQIIHTPNTTQTIANDVAALVAALKSESTAIQYLGTKAGMVITQALQEGAALYANPLESARALFPTPPTSDADAGVLGARAQEIAALTAEVQALGDIATSAEQQIGALSQQNQTLAQQLAAANATLARIQQTTGTTGSEGGGAGSPASSGMSGGAMALTAAGILGLGGLAWYFARKH